MSLVRQQVAIGPRPAGSPQLRRLATRLRTMLPGGAFEPFPTSGPQQGLRNVVGVLPGRAPAILIGAHYDTEAEPRGFVGANDGAAGTAAVLELARSLPRELPAAHREIRFVLFDGEEQPPGCPDANFLACGLRGSKAYARRHGGEIGQMILLDYVANRDLRIPREQLSDRGLWVKLRAAAERAGVGEAFPDGTQTGIIDDHVPFLQQHVPAIDLIDFSYRYRDSLEDTPDKLAAESLDAVGEAVAELVIELSGEPARG
jgi:glutaminyl-peptide cyclotransferase